MICHVFFKIVIILDLSFNKFVKFGNCQMYCIDVLAIKIFLYSCALFNIATHIVWYCYVNCATHPNQGAPDSLSEGPQRATKPTQHLLLPAHSTLAPKTFTFIPRVSSQPISLSFHFSFQLLKWPVGSDCLKFFERACWVASQKNE